MGANQVKFRESIMREFEETTPFNRAEITHSFHRFKSLYDAYYQSRAAYYEDGSGVSNPNHITQNGFANPDSAVPIDYIIENFSELKNNPFRRRMCDAFCVSTDDMMTFTEFLDMVSSFSPKADIDKKTYHAFQIFDWDKDGVISREDMYKVMDVMTGIDEEPLDEASMKEWRKVRKWMVDGVFSDCHKSDKSDVADADAVEVGTEWQYERQNGNGPRGDNIELNERSDGLNTIAEETDDAMDKEIMDKESLTIEDFRFCISRAPDFRNTFSFNI